MNLIQDKQIKYYTAFILTLVLLIFLSVIGINAVQLKTMHGLFLSHDNAVVTSLFQQGVSKDVIAKAITSTTSSQEGATLLADIGITKHTAIRFLPFINEFQKISMYCMLLFSVILSSLLLSGSFIFLWKREQLYLQAAKVIINFTEGDFSYHMPQMKEGTIYRLFACVDQLAMILQSKNEAEKKAKDFLKSTISDISHQLKTPLSALTMYHEIISEEPDHVQTVIEYSQKTELALKRMEQLIQVMLKITRLDAGSIIFEKESCCLSELITQAVSELTTRAAREGKEIIVDDVLEETLICDKQWTCEAIGNIVKNALDHTDSGGKINVSWNRTPSMLRIMISDNGSGIAPEDLHHVFKRFYRSKKSLDTQGIGLGLSLAKSIVEGQGGIISIQSALGEGTVFTISYLT